MRHKGFHHSEETKIKIGLATKGKHNFFKGKKRPIETRIKMSLSAKGKIISKETIKKFSDRMKLVKGEDAPHWKGDKVGYRGLHYWVESILGKPSKCEYCEKSDLKGRQIHWSNVSGEYKREITDWQRLCAKCHAAYDRNRFVLL